MKVAMCFCQSMTSSGNFRVKETFLESPFTSTVQCEFDQPLRASLLTSSLSSKGLSIKHSTLTTYYIHTQLVRNRLGSRTLFNETSQFSERYSGHTPAVTKEKHQVILGQIYLLMIEYPKHDQHVVFSHKGLCYRRATAGTFVLDLLCRYRSLTK